MKKIAIVSVLLALVAVGAAEPVAASDLGESLDPTCVKVYSNPPGAAVDPACIEYILDDLPLQP